MHAEQEAWNVFQKLPQEKKAEVIDFISALQQRVKAESTETNHAAVLPRRFGCGQGIFIDVADDFDAPLDIFKDYMP